MHRPFLFCFLRSALVLSLMHFIMTLVVVILEHGRIETLVMKRTRSCLSGSICLSCLGSRLCRDVFRSMGASLGHWDKDAYNGILRWLRLKTKKRRRRAKKRKRIFPRESGLPFAPTCFFALHRDEWLKRIHTKGLLRVKTSPTEKENASSAITAVEAAATTQGRKAK